MLEKEEEKKQYLEKWRKESDEKVAKEKDAKAKAEEKKKPVAEKIIANLVWKNFNEKVRDTRNGVLLELYSKNRKDEHAFSRALRAGQLEVLEGATHCTLEQDSLEAFRYYLLDWLRIVHPIAD